MAENKKNTPQSTNALDVLLNQLNLFELVEQTSLQTIENQKDWIQATRDQFNQMEVNSKKLTTEWAANLQDILSKNQKEFGGQNFTELTDKLEEIGLESQSLFFSPGKASLEILSNSHAQFEETVTHALEQQRKNREELTNAISSIVEQLKQTQVGILKSFELPVK